MTFAVSNERGIRISQRTLGGRFSFFNRMEGVQRLPRQAAKVSPKMVSPISMSSSG